ncbi:MAG: fatty acid desaturase [Gemmatimonadota bacterium]
MMRLKKFNWPSGLFLIGYHVALLIGLPIYFSSHTPGWPLLAIAFGLLMLTEIGIGAAFHRFYAHRSYEISRPAEAVLLTLGTLAIQGSVLRWAYEHRLHHAYVDTDRDPYSIKKGFWYAHMGWMFYKSQPINLERVPDLAKNPLVMFQDKYHALVGLGGNAVIALLVGALLGDYLGAFVLVFWTRLLLGHHFTWFVNSLAHTWGAKTYSREHSAVDNYILAFLTVGEGYHNYHHTFQSDYRNGFRWYHFDPSKWTIWILSRLGMARNLTRFDIYRIRKRLLSEDLRLLLEMVRQRGRDGRSEMEQKITRLAEAMRTKLNRIAQLSAELKSSHARRRSGSDRRLVRIEFKALGRSLRDDWRRWARLSDRVLEADALPS